MSPVARRVNPPAPPAGGSVNFGGDGFFTGGLGLPEGNYAVSFTTQMFQATKADGTPSRLPAFLSVMGTFYPIDPQTGALIGEPIEHPMNCGGQAHESFLPSADGKGFDAVPNGKAQGMWNLSAFGIFFDSLKNAGLPPGLVGASFDVLDGVWVHTQNIPEPEEKKAFSKRARAKTGAASMMGGQEDEDRVRLVTVVTEILDGGKPWEGSGGIPDADAPIVAKTAPKPAARPAARGAVAGPRGVARPAPTPVEAPDADVADAALSAVAAVLGAKPNGITTLQLKTEAFQACKKESGDDVAQVVMSEFLQSNDNLGEILGQLGYAIQGLMVKPAA